jgi:hypothetical protein
MRYGNSAFHNMKRSSAPTIVTFTIVPDFAHHVFTHRGRRLDVMALFYGWVPTRNSTFSWRRREPCRALTLLP